MLNEEEMAQYVQFVQESKDVFAWDIKTCQNWIQMSLSIS